MWGKLMLPLFPLSVLSVFLGFIFHYSPIVFFVQSEANIPAIVQAVAPPRVVKAGQIWAMRRDANPFEKDPPTAAHVVAVKDGYVQYYFVGQEGFGKWAANSERMSVFASIYTERIK